MTTISAHTDFRSMEPERLQDLAHDLIEAERWDELKHMTRVPAVAARASRALARQRVLSPINRRWHGTLTLDNAYEIAEVIEEMLGGFYFATAACICFPGDVIALEQHVGCRLHRGGWVDGFPGQVRVGIVDDQLAVIQFMDIGKSFGLMSWAEGLRGEHADWKNAHVAFNENSFRVKFRAPAGNLVEWLFTVQGRIGPLDADGDPIDPATAEREAIMGMVEASIRSWDWKQRPNTGARDQEEAVTVQAALNVLLAGIASRGREGGQG